MLELEENKKFLENIELILKDVKESMKIDSLTAELKDLQKESSKEAFWQDVDKSAKVYSKIKSLERKINNYFSLELELKNLLEMNELLSFDFDDEIYKELLKSSNELEKKLEKIKIQTYFSGKYDVNNAILTLHPGARWNGISGLGSNVI